MILGNTVIGDTKIGPAVKLNSVRQRSHTNLLDSAGTNAHFFIPLPGTPYEHETPKLPSKEVRKWLSNLARKGLVNGYWNQHIKTRNDILKLKLLMST